MVSKISDLLISFGLDQSPVLGIDFSSSTREGDHFCQLRQLSTNQGGNLSMILLKSRSPIRGEICKL